MEGLNLSTVPFDLIVNILNIAILYVILRFLVYKPVKKFLNARLERLRAEKESAEKAVAEATEIKKKYTAMMDEGQTKAAELLRDTEREANKRAEKILADATAEAKQMIAGAEDRINAMTDEAYKDMRDEVVDLSITIASKLIERNIDSSDNRRIADTFFDAQSAGSGVGEAKKAGQ